MVFPQRGQTTSPRSACVSAYAADTSKMRGLLCAESSSTTCANHGSAANSLATRTANSPRPARAGPATAIVRSAGRPCALNTCQKAAAAASERISAAPRRLHAATVSPGTPARSLPICGPRTAAIAACSRVSAASRAAESRPGAMLLPSSPPAAGARAGPCLISKTRSVRKIALEPPCTTEPSCKGSGWQPEASPWGKMRTSPPRGATDVATVSWWRPATSGVLPFADRSSDWSASKNVV
mmetsp:Transcript_4041/g.10222  ORF Transcript_4041/g.10222 Transcript_4041/m.10222 type:complete len:240 (+) Transcript_4041:987-1706(+)